MTPLRSGLIYHERAPERSIADLLGLTVRVVAEQPKEQAGENGREEDADEYPPEGTAASRFCHSGGQQDEKPQGEVQDGQSENQEEKTFDHGAILPLDDGSSASSRSTGAVVPARIPAILGRSTRADHLGRNVASIGQETLPDETPVPVYVHNVALESLTGDQAAQRGGCGGTPLLIPLWRIQPPDPDPTGLATQGEGVTVEDLADPRLQCAGLLRLRIGLADEGRRNDECRQ